MTTLKRDAREQVERKQASGSVLKVLDVVEGLAASGGPVSLTRLAELVGLPTATLHRLLRTLELRGYVERVNSDYRLTLKLFEIGSITVSSIDVVTEARPICQRLAEELGETVNMAIRSGSSAIYVMKIESVQSLRLVSQLGMHVPLYCTALGKVLLASLDEPQRSDLLGHLPLEPRTEQTITSWERLERELDGVVRRGWAVDQEEYDHGLVCVAAPVHDRTGVVVGAISVTGPASRIPAESLSALGTRVRVAADAISLKLGSDLGGTTR